LFSNFFAGRRQSAARGRLRFVSYIPVFVLTLLFVFTAAGNRAVAAPITTPGDLVNGQQYRLAFVTSTRRDALSTDIADYNAFVTAAANSQAALTSLGTMWTAIGSTATVDARDNTGTNPLTDGLGVPIYLLDGSTRIADNYADLWDNSIASLLGIQEDGTPAPGLSGGGTFFTESVHTGTFTTGEGFPGRELGNVLVESGLTFTTSPWVANSLFFNTDQLRFFAISDVLTVGATASISEPGAAILLSLGVIGLMHRRMRRR